MMILAVLAGVLFHFTLSPHALEIIAPVKAKLISVEHSAILEEARKHEKSEIHRHFHNIIEFPKLSENKRPVCFICHSDYPHSKTKKVRSLLNMHTQYFVCETCHIKEDEDTKKDTKVVYTWYNPYDDNPKGPFFGTSYDAETGKLVEVEDKLSKIAPYFKKDGDLSSAIQVQDAPLAKDYMKVRDTLTPEQRDGIKMKFHVNVKPKGHECNICHSEDGIFDYGKLGFSKNRTADLKQLNVKGLITKYDDFYLPNLFK